MFSIRSVALTVGSTRLWPEMKAANAVAALDRRWQAQCRAATPDRPPSFAIALFRTHFTTFMTFTALQCAKSALQLAQTQFLAALLQYIGVPTSSYRRWEG